MFCYRTPCVTSRSVTISFFLFSLNFPIFFPLSFMQAQPILPPLPPSTFPPSPHHLRNPPSIINTHLIFLKPPPSSTPKPFPSSSPLFQKKKLPPLKAKLEPHPQSLNVVTFLSITSIPPRPFNKQQRDSNASSSGTTALALCSFSLDFKWTQEEIL